MYPEVVSSHSSTVFEVHAALFETLYRSKKILVNLIRRSLFLSAALAASSACFASPAEASTQLVDDFEAPDAPVPWKFSNGAEFPGATGSIAVHAGQLGKALTIAYDFSKGGIYVAADRALATPAKATLLRFYARVPADAALSVRIRDATGQWLVYDVQRPLAPLDENAQFRTTVELGHSDTHWSGANDGTVHGAIDSISFTIEASGAQKQGSVLIDQIETMDSLEAAIDPSTIQLAPAFPGVKNVLDGLGVAIHSTNDPPALDAAKSAGLSWVKTNLSWSEVEKTRGVYDWSNFDRLLDMLDQRGMRALFILAYGNDLYGGSPPVSAEASAAYAAYAKAAAKHFAGRRVHFEVWNEPDNIFWIPTDPVAYARVAKLAIDAVHLGDPTAQVTTGGLAWFDFDFLAATLEAGAGAHADAIGVHPYRGVEPPESLANDVPRARALIARIGPKNPPLWDTEWGYSAIQFGPGDSPDARKRQAVMAVRRMVSARLVGFPLAFWYDARDDASLSIDSSHNYFGLLGADGSEKPALRALRALRRAVEGRSLAGVLDLAQPALNGLRLDSAQDTVWMLWATLSSSTVRVTMPRPAKAQNFLGDTLSIADTYTLKESDGPIYLFYPRSSVPVGDAGGSSASGGASGLPPVTGEGSTGGSGVNNGTIDNPNGLPSDSHVAGSCGCRVAERRKHGGVLALALGALGAFLWGRRGGGLRSTPR